MNLNLKFIFLLKQTWKHIWQFSLFIIIIIIILFILRTFGFSESSGGWGATSEAFIFSLNNNEGLAPFVSKVKKGNTGKAIYRGSSTGPIFGHDVIIQNNDDSSSLSRARLDYLYSVPPAVKDRDTVLTGTYAFSPDEVEVFYLDPSH